MHAGFSNIIKALPFPNFLFFFLFFLSWTCIFSFRCPCTFLFWFLFKALIQFIKFMKYQILLKCVIKHITCSTSSSSSSCFRFFFFVFVSCADFLRAERGISSSSSSDSKYLLMLVGATDLALYISF